MLLFLKGFVVGIGKIIPGVSGAMLAVNFNVYERAIEAVTNFFFDWRKNLKFILIFGLGIFLSIVLFSGTVLYLLTHYKFITMMFFIGLIFGGTYNFSKEINYNYKNIILIIVVIVIFLILSLGNFNNNYIFKENFTDYIMFFWGGFIDIFASIVPGISGTAILMVMGLYNQILEMISSIFNFSYVSLHLGIYISYGLGMFLSFILNSYLINLCIKKFRNSTYSVILGLFIFSILFLIIITFRIKFTILEFILGIMVLIIGVLLACILDK